MQKIITLAVLTIVAFSCVDSQAANRRVRINSAPVYQTSPMQSNVSRPEGPFARLMEMEQRKNAALRQMFFGR
jgi:hypothetical protein